MSKAMYPQLAGVLLLAVTFVTLPLAAQAYRHNGYRGPPARGYYHGGGNNNGSVIGGALLGLGVGALIGGALAQSQYAPPPPVYYAPPPGAYYAPPPVAYYPN